MKRFAILAVALLALLALPLGAQPAPTTPLLGAALYSAGLHGIIGLCSGNVRCNGTLDPSTFALSNDPTTATVRYHWPDHSIGYTFGPEGTSVEEIQRALNLGCLVVPGLPPGYVVQPWDRTDALYIASGRGNSWYADNVLPCRARPEPSPGATPPPTPPAPVQCRCIGPGDQREPAGCVPPIHTVVSCGPEPTPTPAQPPACPAGCTDVTAEDSTVRTCRCPASCPPAVTCPPPVTCPPAKPCRATVPVTFSQACVRAIQQLAAGKPLGPNRVAGLKECPLAKLPADGLVYEP